MDSVTESTEGRHGRTRDRVRSADLEVVLTGAVDPARAAIVEFSGDTVGEYLGARFEDPAAATHRFLAKLPGYHGWQWAVVVAASRRRARHYQRSRPGTGADGAVRAEVGALG